jgi:hypothetical protein
MRWESLGLCNRDGQRPIFLFMCVAWEALGALGILILVCIVTIYVTGLDNVQFFSSWVWHGKY